MNAIHASIRSIDYPQYTRDFDDATVEAILEMARKLLVETGLLLSHRPFMERIEGKPGVVVRGERVCFEPALVRRELDAYRAMRRERFEKAAAAEAGKRPADWKVLSGAWSLDVIDMDTDKIRPATSTDLAELTRLADSYDMSGANVVQPQDVSPLMRDMAACRGSFENGRDFITSCHSDPRQTPYLIDMFKAVNKAFPVLVISVPPMRMAPESLEEVLYVYDNHWEDIEAGRVKLEPMIYNAPGVSGPISAAACKGLAFTEGLGAHLLLKMLDERIDLPVGAGIWSPTDLRSATFAPGHPRRHMFAYLNKRWLERVAGFKTDRDIATPGAMTSAACALDVQAGIEKTATALVSALQGCRVFTSAGNLCQDDLISGVQMVLDVELVAYIRDLVEAFDPPAEAVTMEGMHQAILDVVDGDMFLSHESTVRMHKAIMTASDIFRRQSLRTFQSHEKTARDYAREVARQRIRNHAFRRSDDELRELSRIYTAAEHAFESA